MQRRGIGHDRHKKEIKIRTTVRGEAKTGVEMEALTATAASALTIYDMCKAFDRGAVISGIKLLKKTGAFVKVIKGGEIKVGDEICIK